MLNWLVRNFFSPKLFYLNISRLLPIFTLVFVVCFSYGICYGLFKVPPDYQQGDCFRIIYVHVPSAFAAMGIYFVMACCAFVLLVWRIKVASVCMIKSASIGAWFTLLALVTGSIWGKPMWGTWWIWDARLTSVLILLFLYLGFLTLHSALSHYNNADRACAVLALTGAINLPIIHYSVIWWNTLHQGSTLLRFSPSIDSSMFYPLLAMIAAFFLFYVIILFMRILNEQKHYYVKWANFICYITLLFISLILLAEKNKFDIYANYISSCYLLTFIIFAINLIRIKRNYE